ncbi:MAG: hypothetical protein ABIN01_08140 [Ferruginibacter sp.]
MRITLSFLTIAILLYSCSNKNKSSYSNLKALNDSLTFSTDLLKNKNDSLFKILIEKLQNEKTAQNAKIWEPKADLLRYLTKETYNYVEESIGNLKSNSVLNNTDSMYMKLDLYRSSILRIDPEIYKDFDNNSKIITHYFDSVKQVKTERFDTYLSNKSKQEQLFILNQTLNNIRIVENEILMFCNNKIN